MNYTTEQKMQIKANIDKIVEYIEKNILPHITYSYETETFGPVETWGRRDEYRGQRYSIALNGPYEHRIRFNYGITSCSAEQLVDYGVDIAMNFLKYWQDAKMYMYTEVANQKEIVEVINNFEI